MIFQNIDFHNVEYIRQEGDCWRLFRYPMSVMEGLDTGEDIAEFSTGIELRFKMKSDEVVLYFKAEPLDEAQVIYIYFGNFQGGFYCSAKAILTEKTEIRIPYPKNMEWMKKISKEYNLPFNPEVVRVVIPYGKNLYMGMEGEVEVPAKEDYPEKTYLAYGSSITHGSLALAAPYSYPFQISQKLSCDYVNLGMPGSARFEKCVAEYIVNRKDWDFLSLEIGINMLKDFDEAAFEERVKQFLEIIAADSRPVFVTSVFRYEGDGQERGKHFREIVKKYATDRFVFTDGLELLDCPYHLAEDMVHPSLEGIRGIADKWSEIMKEKLF